MLKNSVTKKKNLLHWMIFSYQYLVSYKSPAHSVCSGLFYLVM